MKKNLNIILGSVIVSAVVVLVNGSTLSSTVNVVQAMDASELETYKSTKKDELQALIKDMGNTKYSETTKQNLQQLVTDGQNNIDQANGPKSADLAFTTAQTLINNAIAVADEKVTNQDNLDALIVNINSRYPQATKDNLADIVAEGKQNIENANGPKSIKQAFDAAETKINNVIELAELKLQKQDELDEIVTNANPRYSQVTKDNLAALAQAGKTSIDQANGPKTTAAAFEKAETAIAAAVKVAELKLNNQDELNKLIANLENTRYPQDTRDNLAQLVADGKAAIEQANGELSITNAFNTAKNKIDSVYQLADTKLTNQDNLDALIVNINSRYPQATKDNLADIVAEGKQNIENANGPKSIKQAFDAAETKINNVIELAELKLQKQDELDEIVTNANPRYSQATKDNLITLATTGKQKIENGNGPISIGNAFNNAQSSIDAIIKLADHKLQNQDALDAMLGSAITDGYSQTTLDQVQAIGEQAKTVIEQQSSEKKIDEKFNTAKQNIEQVLAAELATVKADHSAALDQLLAEAVTAGYDQNAQSSIQQVIDQTKPVIEQAKTITEVKTKFDTAKNEVETILALAAYKQTATTNLAQWLSDNIVFSEYSEAKQTVITNLYNTGLSSIAAATSQEDVDKAAAETHKLIEIVKAQELKAAQTNRVDRLTDWINGLKGSEQTKQEMAQLAADGQAAIENAKSITDVEAAFQNTITTIKAFQSSVAHRDNALDRLTNWVGGFNYDEKTTQAIEQLVQEGEKQIAAAQDEAAVDAAFDQAVAAINEVKKLGDAKVAKIARLDNWITNLDADTKAQAQELVTVGKQAINNAEDETAVDQAFDQVVNQVNDHKKLNAARTEKVNRLATWATNLKADETLKATIQSLVETYTDQIKQASEQDIDTIFDQAVATVNATKKLNDVKTEKTDRLSNWVKSLDSNTQAQVQDLVTAGKQAINDAQDETTANQAFDQAVATIDAAKRLSSAKTEKTDRLTNWVNGLDNKDDQQIQELLTTGVNNIGAAEDDAGVEQAFTSAVENIKAIRELTAAKTDRSTHLAKWFNSFSDEEKSNEVIVKLYQDGLAKIEQATSLDDVEQVFNEAVSLVNAAKS